MGHETLTAQGEVNDQLFLSRRFGQDRQGRFHSRRELRQPPADRAQFDLPVTWIAPFRQTPLAFASGVTFFYAIFL